MSKQYSVREAVRILNDNGWNMSRKAKGSHMVFSNGVTSISIPVVKKDINKMMFQRLCKENGIYIA